MRTRIEYIKGDCTQREYYAQFVNAETKALVLHVIGRERIMASKGEHFNDIPLATWDALVPKAPGSGGFAKAGDYYTLAGGVCMLKEAAQQIRETS